MLVTVRIMKFVLFCAEKMLERIIVSTTVIYAAGTTFLLEEINNEICAMVDRKSTKRLITEQIS